MYRSNNLICAMHITATLSKQVRYRFQQALWKNRKTLTLRKLIDFKIPTALVERGATVYEATDVVKQPLEQIKFPAPYCVPNDLSSDSKNPLWHDRPAYLVTHKTRLVEAEKHMSVLTKCLINEGLPDRYIERLEQISSDSENNLEEQIRCALTDDAQQDRLPKKLDLTKPYFKFPKQLGIRIERKVGHLVFNLNVMTRKLEMPSAFKPLVRDIAAQYILERDGSLMSFYSHIDSVTLSKQPILPILSEPEIEETVHQELPDLYPANYTIELKQSNIYHDEPVYSSIQLPNHVHTLNVTHPYFYYWSPEQKLSRAIQCAFTFAASKAAQLYGPETKQLLEPIIVQCIYNDVQNFGFVVFQLNTLDFSTERGIKNVAWYDGPHQLYDKCEPDSPLEGYNPEVLRRFRLFYAS